MAYWLVAQRNSQQFDRGRTKCAADAGRSTHFTQLTHAQSGIAVTWGGGSALNLLAGQRCCHAAEDSPVVYLQLRDGINAPESPHLKRLSDRRLRPRAIPMRGTGWVVAGLDFDPDVGCHPGRPKLVLVRNDPIAYWVIGVHSYRANREFDRAAGLELECVRNERWKRL